jgi:hypothetical protein
VPKTSLDRLHGQVSYICLMKFTLLNRKTLTEIPSASGIEVMGETIYVMSDDSPWLFKLNNKFELVEKLQIGDIDAAVAGKIPKSRKQDLEAMTTFGSNILLFGSGSKSPQRDVMVQIDIENSGTIKKYSLVEFYNHLCSAAQLDRSELNIEAAVIIEKTLYLFNRGKNRIFKLDVTKFFSHVENNAPVPSLEICSATLPFLNGIESGFSGAALSLDAKYIVFTASVENTPNWVDDGEILGSFVGIFPLDEFGASCNPGCIAITDLARNILKIKVESVAVQKSASPNTLRLLMVTDNDGDSSELIEAEILMLDDYKG